jgi:hypothetical protein
MTPIFTRSIVASAANTSERQGARFAGFAW